MGKSRSQKLVNAAQLIKNHCQAMMSRDKCTECVFHYEGSLRTCLLDPPGEFEPYDWIIPKQVTAKSFVTKADEIRAMSNNELAKLLCNVYCEFCIYDSEDCAGDIPCIDGVKAWLAQEVGDDE